MILPNILPIIQVSHVRQHTKVIDILQPDCKETDIVVGGVTHMQLSFHSKRIWLTFKTVVQLCFCGCVNLIKTVTSSSCLITAEQNQPFIVQYYAALLLYFNCRSSSHYSLSTGQTLHLLCLCYNLHLHVRAVPNLHQKCWIWTLFNVCSSWICSGTPCVFISKAELFEISFA